MSLSFSITAQGHPNVRATHSTTLEITRDRVLTVNGDCIIGVNASHGLRDLPEKMKTLLRSSKAVITVKLFVLDQIMIIKGKGHAGLTLDSADCFICRTSDYVDRRTLMIESDKAAKNIPRELVKLLQNPIPQIRIEITVQQD